MRPGRCSRRPLEEFRARDMPLGEGQVLAFLGEKAFREGDLDRSCELFLESAAIAHEADWTWWELGQLGSRRDGRARSRRLDAAEDLASRSLALAVGIGDRQHIVFAGALLAIDRGGARRRAGPGCIWGAVEAEARAAALASGRATEPSSRSSSSLPTAPGSRTPGHEGSLLSISQAAGLEPARPPSRWSRAASARPTPAGRWSGSRRGSIPSPSPRP